MSSRVLGISAFYHDSAAALVVDGRIVAAAEEERFSRIKHDAGFPARAVAYCLREGGIGVGDLDAVVYYDDPWLTLDRLLETHFAFAPRGLRGFLAAMPRWFETKFALRHRVRKALGPGCRAPVLCIRHHESHAASAFYPSPFDEAAILTIDGVGEWDTAAIGHGRGREIRLLRTLRFPHSLGLLYTAFTTFAGFEPNEGEYKLMGLAASGRPVYAPRILEHLVDLRDDGSLAMDMTYFNYAQGLTMTSPAFAALFDGPPREPGAPITDRERNLAASVQAVTEEAVLRMARTAQALTGSRHLVMAGGVALNCVANGRLQRSGLFDRIWVQPAAGDAGGALGAAFIGAHRHLAHPRVVQPDDAQQGSRLGPAFTTGEIAAWLRAEGIAHEVVDDDAVLLDRVAAALADQDVVGWFEGRMEFGPRALGGRSILADPRGAGTQQRVNERIKFRETFRPFAPSVLADQADRYFDLSGPSPYMLMTAPVRDPSLPAVTHVDGSARVQTVDAARHGRYHRLLMAFHRRTGCPVLLNTSFNLRGEPIVATPQDAWRTFLASSMDLLVLERCLVRRPSA